MEILGGVIPQKYSQETLFIPILVIEKNIHSNTLTKSIDIIHDILFTLLLTLFIICINVSFFLFSKFFSYERKIVEAHIGCYLYNGTQACN